MRVDGARAVKVVAGSAEILGQALMAALNASSHGSGGRLAKAY